MINAESFKDHAFVFHFLAKSKSGGESLPIGIVQSLHNFSSPLLRCLRCKIIKPAATWDAINLDMFSSMPARRFSYTIGSPFDSPRVIIPPSVYFTRYQGNKGNYAYRCPVCGDVIHTREIEYTHHSTIIVQPIELLQRLATLASDDAPTDYRLDYIFYLTGVSGVRPYLDIYSTESDVSLPITIQDAEGRFINMPALSFAPTEIELGLDSLTNDAVRRIMLEQDSTDVQSIQCFTVLFKAWLELRGKTDLNFNLAEYIQGLVDLEILEEQIQEAITFGVLR